MSGDFYFRSLQAEDLTDMYLAFLAAFSDYPISFQLTKNQFVRKFVKKLNIDFELSIGAFHQNDTLAGFIFTSVSEYQNKLTAYNGGTGVRPKYRGNKLTYHLYDYLLPKLKERAIEQCVLEVLVDNERAIKAYNNIGFKKVSLLKCFKATDRSLREATPSIDHEIVSVYSPNWETYKFYSDRNASFLDTNTLVDKNLDLEQISEVHVENECVGFIIFQPSTGRIGQFALSGPYRSKGLGLSLLNHVYHNSEQKSLTVLNVNEEAKEIIGFLEYIGFENQINQYEMVLDV